AWGSALISLRKCDFGGKLHSNISMEDSAKVTRHKFMTKRAFDRPRRRDTLSRRRALELGGGATVFTFWQRKAHGPPAPGYFVDHLAAERIADRDPVRPPI